MSSKNNIVKSALLSLFNKGKSEEEAYKELSKTQSSQLVTLSVVSKWYDVFKSEEYTSDNKKKQGQKLKFTDEYLINLVNENPNLCMNELAKLANTSLPTISNRLKQVNIDGESLYHKINISKNAKLLTDELLIEIVNENPELNMKELGELIGIAASTISRRIKSINRDGQVVNYVKKCSKNKLIKITDESLINLIDNNPDLNLEELSKLAGISIHTISKRIKHIDLDKRMVNYSKKGPKYGATKFSDEYLINLIKESPELNMMELAKLAGTSPPTISNRLRQINDSRPDADKIVLPRHKFKSFNISESISDEYLIKLVNDNPDLSLTELANAANISLYSIWCRIKKINSDGERINYIQKRLKFTDEFLIKLVDENPDLNMKELAKLAGVSTSTIFNRIKKINSGDYGQKVNYHKKEFRNNVKKLTEECLINLINENPGLNMSELAEIANSSVPSISRKLKNINKDGEKVNYVKKYK
jgi:transcriptional antiterminator